MEDNINMMPDAQSHDSLSENELIKLVRETGPALVRAILMEKNIDKALEYVVDDIIWLGAKEELNAKGKEELRRSFEKRIAALRGDGTMKILRLEAFSLGENHFSSTGEIEIRLSYEEKPVFVSLKFMFAMKYIDGRMKILQGQMTETNNFDKTFVEQESRLLERVFDEDGIEIYDPLTGVYTLDYFKKQVRKHWQEDMIEKKSAVLYTDIKNFEKLNNLYGVQMADKLLVSLAAFIQEFGHEVVLYSRSVADHFLLLLEYNDREKLVKTINNACEEFDARVKDQFPNAVLRLGAGVYEIEDLEMPIDEIIEHANSARKGLRMSSVNSVSFYDSKMFVQAKKVKSIEKSMQKALDDGEFKVYLQPKYDLMTGNITGAEALVRWIRPDGSMVYPDEFIPVFEKNGFVEQIDFYMLEQICTMIQRRRKEKKKCVPISVNQSRVLLQRKDYTTKVAKILLRHETPPQLIELELTERLFSDRYEELFIMMEQLKRVGIRWSIDDFGTGYSSLNLLKELPIDIVKLDKSFLDESLTSNVSRVIIRKIVELVKELEKSIICEGVETNQQANYLREIECDMAQGYLYARPMPMADFEKLLDESQSRL